MYWQRRNCKEVITVERVSVVTDAQDTPAVKEEDGLALLGTIKKSKLTGVLKSTQEFDRLKEKGKYLWAKVLTCSKSDGSDVCRL